MSVKDNNRKPLNRNSKNKRAVKKVHSFLKAFGILETKEMQGYDYKKALNRDSLWAR